MDEDGESGEVGDVGDIGDEGESVYDFGEGEREAGFEEGFAFDGSVYVSHQHAFAADKLTNVVPLSRQRTLESQTIMRHPLLSHKVGNRDIPPRTDCSQIRVEISQTDETTRLQSTG